MKRWRLILDSARGAAENMAIDEAIMRSCANGNMPPTLRIYSWTRPSISLGCFQPVAPGKFDIDFCRSEGIEVVRRITGGRAVIHGTDVTFSIALCEADLPDGCSSVLASHRWLMSGIVAGLRRLGIDANVGPQRGSASVRDVPADCFAHVAECDVRVGQSKAVGSAQVRRFGALLEQGSIPYAPPAFDTARVFGRASRGGQSFPLGGFDYPSIAEATADGFADCTSLDLERTGLTQEETETAARLASELYSTEQWTLRGPTGL